MYEYVDYFKIIHLSKSVLYWNRFFFYKTSILLFFLCCNRLPPLLLNDSNKQLIWHDQGTTCTIRGPHPTSHDILRIDLCNAQFMYEYFHRPFKVCLQQNHKALIRQWLLSSPSLTKIYLRDIREAIFSRN